MITFFLSNMPDRFRTKTAVLLGAILLTLLSAASGLAAPKLTFAVQPYLPTEELTWRFQPLADYLAEQLGQPVELRIGRNYAHHIEFIGKGQADIAFIGPAPYIRLVARHGHFPILARLQSHGNWFYIGKIITRQDSGITSLAQLKGKRFAFGSPHSTMSSILPRYVMLQNGIFLSDLEKFDYLGTHANVALGVLAGDYDAGAVKEEVFKKYAGRGLSALAALPPIPEHVLVAGRHLPLSLRQRIQEALFALKDSARGRQILEEIKGATTEVAAGKDQDYDPLREIIETISDLQE